VRLLTTGPINPTSCLECYFDDLRSRKALDGGGPGKAISKLQFRMVQEVARTSYKSQASPSMTSTSK